MMSNISICKEHFITKYQFSLAILKIIFLVLAFSIFTMVCLFVGIFMFILLGVVELPKCVGNLSKVSNDFPAETTEAKMQWHNTFKVEKGK